MAISSFDAYMMFLQTNSEAERKELIPIILSDPSATLSFLRTEMWNYKCPYRLFLKALNIILDQDNPKFIVSIIKDSNLFDKLSKAQKMKTIKRIVYFYEHGTLKESLEILLNHSYNDWEIKNLFDIIRPLLDSDDITIDVFLKFCVLFKSKITDEDLWKLVYKIVTTADTKNAHILLEKKPIILNKKMIDTLEASLVANKLQPKYEFIMGFMGIEQRAKLDTLGV